MKGSHGPAKYLYDLIIEAYSTMQLKSYNYYNYINFVGIFVSVLICNGVPYVCFDMLVYIIM